MSLLKKLKNYTFCVSFIYIVIGLIMVLNPGFIGNAVNYVIGSLLIVYGIVYLGNLYQKKDENMWNKFNFLAGILSISFGLFLILNSGVLLSLIPFCAGVIIFIDALFQLRNSFNLKRLGNTRWWFNLVVAILFLGFAIFLIIRSQAITNLVIQIIGGVLIFDACMDFYTYFSLKKSHVTREIKVIKTEIVEK